MKRCKQKLIVSYTQKERGMPLYDLSDIMDVFHKTISLYLDAFVRCIYIPLALTCVNSLQDASASISLTAAHFSFRDLMSPSQSI